MSQEGPTIENPSDRPSLTAETKLNEILKARNLTFGPTQTNDGASFEFELATVVQVGEHSTVAPVSIDEMKAVVDDVQAQLMNKFPNQDWTEVIYFLAENNPPRIVINKMM